jgi:hypothetical protein
VSQAVSIRVTILGDKAFIHDIEAISIRAGDMSLVLEKIKDRWIDWIEKQFESEGKRSLEPWPQLSRETVLRRGSAHPILIRTADLLLETTDESNYWVTDSTIIFNARDEVEQYGRFHQSGTTKMPARPIIDWNVWDRLWMMDSLEDFLFHGRLPL